MPCRSLAITASARCPPSNCGQPTMGNIVAHSMARMLHSGPQNVRSKGCTGQPFCQPSRSRRGPSLGAQITGSRYNTRTRATDNEDAVGTYTRMLTAKASAWVWGLACATDFLGQLARVCACDSCCIRGRQVCYKEGFWSTCLEATTPWVKIMIHHCQRHNYSFHGLEPGLERLWGDLHR